MIERVEGEPQLAQTIETKESGGDPRQERSELCRPDNTSFVSKLGGPAKERAWERQTCRACGSIGLPEVLSLGNLPPANAFLHRSELERPERRFPLSLRLCEQCGMVQLGHVVPPELLFRNYLFYTSSSKRMSEHFASLMSENAARFVRPTGLIVEIGSNDGTALTSIRCQNVRIIGVDPARNVAVAAAARSVPTIAEFFSEALACEIARTAGQADLIVACNVMGHIDDLDDVCRGVQLLLSHNGAFVFEVPYLAEMLKRCEYDTIYHEHLSYFAIRPLARLLNRHGLRLERVEVFPVHGGSIRCTAVHGDGCSPCVGRLISDEMQIGLSERATFEWFGHRVEELRAGLRDRLTALRDEGLVVIGYGAPAKGTVVLNYCDIGTDLLRAVLDCTPAKQGLYVPGTHQPVLPPMALEAGRPDVLLLLAWNHAEEIMEREPAFRARDGRFLTPHLEEL